MMLGGLLNATEIKMVQTLVNRHTCVLLRNRDSLDPGQSLRLLLEKFHVRVSEQDVDVGSARRPLPPPVGGFRQFEVEHVGVGQDLARVPQTVILGEPVRLCLSLRYTRHPMFRAVLAAVIDRAFLGIENLNCLPGGWTGCHTGNIKIVVVVYDEL